MKLYTTWAMVLPEQLNFERLCCRIMGRAKHTYNYKRSVQL